MKDSEWGPWIKHDGTGCPVPVGTRVWLKMHGCHEIEGTVGPASYDPPPGFRSRWFWLTPDRDGIAAYRVHRLKALRDLIKLVETLPADARSEQVSEDM